MKHIILSLLFCLSSFVAIGQSDSTQYKEALCNLIHLMKENVRISEQQDSVYREEFLKPRIKELDSLIQQASHVQNDSTIQQVAERLNISYNSVSMPNRICQKSGVLDNSMSMRGTDNALGYKNCLQTYYEAVEAADKAYGVGVDGENEIVHPSYIESVKDYIDMNSAISIGSAWVKLRRSYDLSNRQQLILVLDCEQGHHLFMMMTLP